MRREEEGRRRGGGGGGRGEGRGEDWRGTRRVFAMLTTSLTSLCCASVSSLSMSSWEEEEGDSATECRESVTRRGEEKTKTKTKTKKKTKIRIPTHSYSAANGYSVQ